MQHYLKTYKKLEKMGIATNAMNCSYDMAFLVSALAQSKTKQTQQASSMRFNKTLHARLGLRMDSSMNVLKGTCLLLIPFSCDGFPSDMRQKKLQLGLNAAKLLRKDAHQNRIDPYHFLGLLLVGPSARPLLIHRDEFQCALFSTAPQLTLRACRQAYGRPSAPYRKTLTLLKRMLDIE